MPHVPFQDLPDDGRLWVFPASRTLSEEEASTLLEVVDRFLEGWAAHGAPLRSGRELRERRFLLVGVDEHTEAPSGCSIDALANSLQAAADPFGVKLLDHAPVWYRDGEEIRMASRPEFRALATSGELDAGVRVFDTTLTRIGAAREGRLERPARETWHGRAFFREPARR